MPPGVVDVERQQLREDVFDAADFGRGIRHAGKGFRGTHVLHPQDSVGVALRIVELVELEKFVGTWQQDVFEERTVARVLAVFAHDRGRFHGREKVVLQVLQAGRIEFSDVQPRARFEDKRSVVAEDFLAVVLANV